MSAPSEGIVVENGKVELMFLGGGGLERMWSKPRGRGAKPVWLLSPEG
jgi:hypothetical protein